MTQVAWGDTKAMWVRVPATPSTANARAINHVKWWGCFVRKNQPRDLTFFRERKAIVLPRLGTTRAGAGGPFPDHRSPFLNR